MSYDRATQRDKIWIATLSLAGARSGFQVKDVRGVCKQLDGDTPTTKTVNDCVNAMVELGFLERLGSKGCPSAYVIDDGLGMFD